MAYRFKLNESLTRGVRRIGLSQLELAERCLKNAPDPAIAIHEVRKSLKRLRALLRLVRPALDAKTYRRENEQLRDTARVLSATRDRDVLRQTIVKLDARLSDRDKGVVPRLHELLEANGADRTAGSRANDLRKARGSLSAAKKRFARLRAEPDRFALLETGLRKSYRTGKRALAKARAEADEEVFHELRKAVQQHWRQMLLLSRAWPEVCKGRAAAAREIAQLLGDEHDYALLSAFAASQRGKGLSDREIQMLQRACHARQLELRARALPKAQRLFADDAGSFASQISCYWAAACEIDRLEATERKRDHKGPTDAPHSPDLAELHTGSRS